MKPPKAYPCNSCPYRRDVPAGVWAEEEYYKLPEFDADTGIQPMGVFVCHQQDDTICSGWAGTHDMNESMGLRIAVLDGRLSVEDQLATLDYESPVPLFESGQDAAAHGLSGVEDPSPRSLNMIAKLRQKEARRGRSTTH